MSYVPPSYFLPSNQNDLLIGLTYAQYIPASGTFLLLPYFLEKNLKILFDQLLSIIQALANKPYLTSLTKVDLHLQSLFPFGL